MEFKIQVCNYRSSELDVHVSAEYRDGLLLFSAQDLGPTAENLWGDSDCEYWYSFDQENTARLMAALEVTEEGFEQAIKEHFSDINGMKILREFCEAHKIAWSFNSYT